MNDGVDQPHLPAAESTDDLLGELVLKPSRRRSLVVRVLAGGAAAALGIIGIVGIIMPVIPGWPFFILAIPLLGMCSERMRRWANRLDRRFPLWLRLALRRRPRRRQA